MTVQSAEALTWPLTTGIPPARASAYQERPSLTDLGVVGTFVLAGTAGVGKTQAAAEIFRTSQHDLRIWVQATSRSSVLHGYAVATKRLGLARDEGVNDETVRLLFDFLQSLGRSWLVILDDIQDPAHLRDLWPPTGGLTLATTRRQDAEFELESRAILVVDTFEDAEALAYLKVRLGPSISRRRIEKGALDEAHLLASDLGNLPLALSQAASFIVDQKMNCGVYRRMFADRRTSLSELFPEEARADSYKGTIATTWELAIGAADRTEPKMLASPIAQLIAVLSPSPVPQAAFGKSASLDYLAQKRAIATGVDLEDRLPVSAAEARSALHLLDRLSLISFDLDTSFPLVRMHGLTARVVRESIQDGGFASCFIADSIDEVWNEVAHSVEQVDVLQRNISTLASNYSDLLIQVLGIHPVFFRCLVSYSDSSRHSDAQWLAEALLERTDSMSLVNRDTLVLRSNRASAIGELGDWQTAVELFEQLVEGRERLLGVDDPDTLRTRHNLIYCKMHLPGASFDLTEALTQLVADRARVMGESHPDTLFSKTLQIIASGNLSDGRDEKVAALISGRESTLGKGDSTVLKSRMLRAAALLDNDQADEAAEILETLIVDATAAIGPKHPLTLEMKAYYAAALARSDRADLGFSLLQKSTAEFEEAVGTLHPTSVRLRMSLANLIGAREGADRAIVAWRKIESQMTNSAGPVDPGLLIAVHQHLGHWLAESKDYAGAAKAGETLAQLRENQLRPDHESKLDALLGAAPNYQMAGDFESAGKIFCRLMEKLPLEGPLEGLAEFIIRDGHAAATAQLGRYEEAMALYDDILIDFVAKLGDHREGYVIKSNRAYWLSRAGDQSASKVLEVLLADAESAIGVEDPVTKAIARNYDAVVRMAGEGDGAGGPSSQSGP